MALTPGSLLHHSLWPVHRDLCPDPVTYALCPVPYGSLGTLACLDALLDACVDTQRAITYGPDGPSTTEGYIYIYVCPI